MVTVKNTQAGPRGINTVAGPVSVDPGATVDVKLSKAEFRSAERTGWFDLDGDAEPDEGEKAPAADVPADDGLEDQTIAQLTELASAEAIDLGDAKLKADIVAAIRTARSTAPEKEA
ncbi:hypothetical protein [Sandarakinorhabdus sp. DWP1-3-1]|uniref:hypothetical protein n=1 Tax=Sandarakinorhabdus sp. DWP1-3-1 TaxID=2804627 RepID=UPI003CF3142F